MADVSTISAGTAIRGRITAKGDLEVHGRVEGSIEAGGEVTVAAGALLKSDVTAERLRVAGAVAGNLRGRELVVLESGARVVGDLNAPTVGIRPGALLRGRVDTKGVGGAPRDEAAPRAAADTRGAPRRAGKAPAPRKDKKAAKAGAARRAPPPVIPKAGGKGRKASTKKRKATAPAPQVPALKKRTKKAGKRRSG